MQTGMNIKKMALLTANPNLFPILNHALKLFNKCIAVVQSR